MWILRFNRYSYRSAYFLLILLTIRANKRKHIRKMSQKLEINGLIEL
jgi:hypothetical protein